MGFLDKVQSAIDKGQDKLEDVKSKRTSDHLLRDLGAWYYATRTGRDAGEGGGHVERLVGELQAFEVANGPLGGAAAPAADQPPDGPGDAVVPDGGPSPSDTAAPLPPPPPMAPPAPPMPSTSPPPPPPPSPPPPPASG